MFPQPAKVQGWCGRRDLNPHDLRHGNLNPARLPVPPRPQGHFGAEPISGLYVATLTPFDSQNRVDPAVIRAHVESLIESGVDGIAPVGTTGEFFYLSIGEKIRIIEQAVAATSGRIGVVAGSLAKRAHVPKNKVCG